MFGELYENIHMGSLGCLGGGQDPTDRGLDGKMGVGKDEKLRVAVVPRGAL